MSATARGHGADAVAAKADSYYGNERADVVAELAPPLGRVLDIGCGSGGVGRSLRKSGATHLVGVEILPAPAAAARKVYDHVHEGGIAEVLDRGEVNGPFDLFVLYDVLEHLLDPGGVLRRLRPLAAPGARVHVSVPNARHFSLVRDIVLRGTFGYTEWGHRDITHLRWFTRRDIEALLEREGFSVSGSSAAILGRNRLVDRLTRGRTREFTALQWHVLAHVPA